MIFESIYWKDELLNAADFLQKKKGQKRWRGASYAKVEQKIMTSFYSIRKLVEANKLSGSIVGLTVPIEEYSSTGKAITWLNNHKVDELYDLENKTTKSEDLRFICNQFIHSYVFMIVTASDSNGLQAVLVNSDRTKDERLICVDVDTLISIFESVGRNYPWQMHFTYDETKGDYKVVCE